MNRLSLWWAAAIVAAVVGEPALAEEPPKAAAPAAPKIDKPAPVLSGPYAKLAAELGLTDEQKANIATKLAERDAALRVWDEAHKARQEEVNRLLAEARQRGDKQAVNVNASEFNTLRRERAALGDRYEEAVVKGLPPEKQGQWYAYLAFGRDLTIYRPVKLTEPQQALMKEKFLAAGPEFRSAITDVARNEIVKQLRAKVEAEVLTEEQRQILLTEREAAKKPPGPKKTK